MAPLVPLLILALSTIAGASLPPLCPVQMGSDEKLKGVTGTPTVVLSLPLESYVILATDQGHVVKVDKTTLEVLDRVAITKDKMVAPEADQALDASFISGQIWVDGDSLFLGSQGFPGAIYRIRISTFEVESVVRMGVDEPAVSSLVLVPAGEGKSPYVAATVKAVPSKVVLFSVQETTLQREHDITLEQEENFARGVVFNSETDRLVVLSDSIPPHVTELGMDLDEGTLKRATPRGDLMLPLVTTTGDDLSDLTMVCHSVSHGDRLFAGTHEMLLRINTTLVGEERVRYASVDKSKYTSSRDMVERVDLPTGHLRSRSCAHDSVLDRLYVATKAGLVVYDTAKLGQAKGGICRYEIGSNGVHAVGYDRYNAMVYAASSTAEYGVVMHAMSAIPRPSVESMTPAQVPVSSGRLLDFTGGNFTDIFGSAPQIEIAKVRGDGTLTDPQTVDADLKSRTRLELSMPSFVGPGEYKLKVIEYGSMLVSEPVGMYAYEQPTLVAVAPALIKATGGSLITITGRNFVDTGNIVVDFYCALKHMTVSEGVEFVSSTSVTFRSPELQDECSAMVRVSLNGGADFTQEYVGHVQVVNVHLTVAEPSVVLLKGDGEFKIMGTGYVDKDDVVVKFRKQGVVGSASAAVPFNVPVYFDDALSVAMGKTPTFTSTGVYSIDLYMDGVLVSAAPLKMEVVNMTISGLTVHTASTVGGIEVGIRGRGMPKYDHPITAKLMPEGGGEQVSVGAYIDDDQKLATFTQPALSAGVYRVELWISSAEYVVVPQKLTVYQLLPFAWGDGSTCVMKGVKSHLLLGRDPKFTDESAVEAAGFLAKALHPAVKCLEASTTGLDKYEEAGSVATIEFFQGRAKVVTSSKVLAVEQEDALSPSPLALINVTTKFPDAGRDWRCFLTLNGLEWHLVREKLWVYDFVPVGMKPAKGPTTGRTTVVVEGTGHLIGCGTKAPQIRLSSGNMTGNASITSMKIGSNGKSLTFVTPAVKHRGTVDAEVTIDHVHWIKMPKNLPMDNFLYYNSTLVALSPHMVSSAGGTPGAIIGTHFPTGAATIKLSPDPAVSGMQVKLVEGNWESTAKMTFTVPQLSAGATGIHTYRVDISFNGQNWYNLSKQKLTVYEHKEETQLGFSPVAGPVAGDTPISFTIHYGAELLKSGLAVKFVCQGGKGDATVAVTGSPEVGSGGSSGVQLATYSITAPAMPNPCNAELQIARNGHDFRSSGHYYTYYRVEESSITLSPATLLNNSTALLEGHGFVNTGDEASLRLTNGATSNPTNYILVPLTFVDDTTLQFTVPDCSGLFTLRSEDRVKVELTFNGEQWLDLPATYPFTN